MTGHRRASGKPLAHTATEKRRTEHTRHRLTTATTPTQLIAAVLDHARAVLTHASPDVATRLADRITRAVLTETMSEGRRGR